MAISSAELPLAKCVPAGRVTSFGSTLPLAAHGFLAEQGFLAAHGFFAAQGFLAAQGFFSILGAQGLLAAHGFLAEHGFILRGAQGLRGAHGLWAKAAGAPNAMPKMEARMAERMAEGCCFIKVS